MFYKDIIGAYYLFNNVICYMLYFVDFKQIKEKKRKHTIYKSKDGFFKLRRFEFEIGIRIGTEQTEPFVTRKKMIHFFFFFFFFFF